ncbi:MAG: hypothetical protein HOP16_07005 [Acidobacteria bacterium]|nr:hypothetical protein [Acidobacteriota bacterium]
MPLILAVEPDPLRLAHVTSLVRGKARTDLLIAESVRSALSALVARVPDVLLLSPALSKEDRDQITECLTILGPAAARVKVLTTPPPSVSVDPVPAVVNAPVDSSEVPTDVATPAPTPAGPPVQDEWGFFDPKLCGFSALSSDAEDAASTEKPDPALVKLIPY